MKTHTHCPHCGNEHAQSTCHACGNALVLPVPELDLLRGEILRFQSELGEKSQEFLRRINLLEQNSVKTVENKPEVQKAPEPKVILPPVPEIQKVQPPTVKPEKIQKQKPLPKASYSTQPTRTTQIRNSKPYAQAAPRTPMELPFWVKIMFAPLLQLMAYAKATHTHFKDQGRLPVFFLSLGGIIAMLFGVGYLMQLGINYFMDLISPALMEGLKIATALAGASVILFLGLRFSKKGAKYQDFGSALQGLAVASFYLIFYFLPQSEHFPFFAIPALSLALIAGTAVLGSFLALRTETRILALVSFLGAALIPLLMEHFVIEEMYLGFLGLLTISSLYLARRIAFQPLRVISMIVVVGIIEWMFFADSVQLSAASMLVALHFFSYLFIAHVLWKKAKLIRTFATQDVFVISSMLSVLILNALSLGRQEDLTWQIGWTFVANAVLWGLFCVVKFPKISDAVKWLCLLIIGAFLTLAAVLLLNQNYLALGVGVETLLLLAFGFRFTLGRVRIEAYVLGGLVLLRCIYGMLNFVGDWQSGLWSDTFMHLLIAGAVLGGGLLLMQRFAQGLSAWESNLRYALRESFFLWTISTVFYIVSLSLGIWTYNFALLPMIFMIYWGIKHGLPLSEKLGWLLGILFAASYALSATEVESLHFFEQRGWGKLALLEGFAMLWLIKYLYEKWAPASSYLEFADVLRRVFFMALPVVFLPGVNRHYPDLLPFAGWASVLICYGLAKYRQKSELITETHILVLLATYLIFDPLTVPGASSGLLVLGIIYGMERAHTRLGFKESVFKRIHKYSFLYLGLVILLGLFKINDLLAFHIAWPVLALYFLVLYIQRQSIAALKQDAQVPFVMFSIFSVGCCIYLILSIWNGRPADGYAYAAVLLIMIMAVFASVYGYELDKKLGSFAKYKDRLMRRFVFLQILAILSYVCLWDLITHNALGMGLTLTLFAHAIGLLFLSAKTEKEWIQKMAFLLLCAAFAKLILFDFRHFSLVYKVGVSILSGSLMLLGARVYLKRLAA